VSNAEMRTTGDVRLTFPAKADYLLLARLALAGLARAYPLEADVLADLKLAVTEACGNAVRHAYVNGDEGSGTVTVTFSVSPERLDMVVEDEGSGLEPTEDDWSLPPELEGGMGMAIIQEIVDELEVARGADGYGTVVRMTKYLPAGA
jgi:serine/threonine-protein kinase RsbW